MSTHAVRRCHVTVTSRGVALPPLAPGLYTVHWRIFTRDGHLSHGRFSFQVAGRE